MSNLPVNTYVEPPDFEDRVSEYLIAMCAALKTFGKGYSVALVQAWLIVLRLRKITAQELTFGVAHFLSTSKEMPTPAEFANWIVDEREAWEARALVDATYRHERYLSATYRQALVEQGINPDELIPIADAAQSLALIEGSQKELTGRMKALPDANWADPEHEKRIKDQLSDLRKVEA